MTAALALSAWERSFFASLNSVVEPLIKAGWASAKGLPAGLVVVEAPGRRTGAKRDVPLLALSVADHLIVATVRGRRSGWIKNLAAASEVRAWVGGTPIRATARVFAGKEASSGAEADLPLMVRPLVCLLSQYQKWGLAFAVLSPVS